MPVDPQASDGIPNVAGARFWSIDLHVHTPGSSDVMISQYGEASAEDIVDTALAAGLDAIAITDHNDASWCDRVGDAAIGKPLIVLPGVEISTTEGHLLAVFEEGTTSRHIEDLLAAVGIPSSSQGQLTVTTTSGFVETAREVAKAGGIAIAAHIDRDKGLLGIEVGARRKEALLCSEIMAFEIVDKNMGPVAQRKAGNDRSLAFARGSDSMVPGEDGHRLGGIGQRRTWAKAGMPDLLGLRHAFSDPELRIRLEEPKEKVHAHVKSLEVSGGFLDGVSIAFSPDMTCLLGGTGTGKSLALELIRFALDQQTDAAELGSIREEVDCRLGGALGADSSVSLVVSKPEGESVIRRAFSGSESPPPEVIDSPDLDVSAFMPIRAFSQGEVIEYARTPVGRMLLIDGNLDLANEDAQEKTAIEGLDTNGKQIAKLLAKIEGTREAIDELGDSADRLAELSDLFDVEIVKEQECWSTEGVAIRSLVTAIPDKGVLDISLDLMFDDVASNKTNEDLFSAARSAIGKLRSKVDKANIETEKARSKAAKALADLETEWLRRRQLADIELNQAVADAGVAGEDLGALRATLAGLQTRESNRKRLQKQLDRLENSKLKKAREERESAIEELVQIRLKKRQKRKQRIKSLNSLMAGVVKLKLIEEADAAAFTSGLLKIAQGSRLRATTLQAIADNALPLKLVRSFIDGEANHVAEATGTTTAQVQKLFDHIEEADLVRDLLTLQHVELRDTLRIRFKKAANARYEEIERLSHGQKCTAILVIALADGTEPLIIDQPEDALHAPWIEDHLVERLRSLRGARQFIFASRSPGLVVSADAELVVTLEADAEQGRVEASGSLERFDLNRLALYHLGG